MLSNGDKMNPVERASKAWEGDWRERVCMRVAALGFNGIDQFMNAFPAEPYIALVNRLGDDVAPIQLECVQFDDAEKRSDLRIAAIDSLVRDLRRYLDKGWEGGARGNFATVQAQVAWLRRLDGSSRNRSPNADMHRLGESIWNALEQMQPPIGWLPAGLEDDYIRSAFNEAWPE
jgi:hypothetical protein